MTKFNSEQIKAIDALNQNIIVSASAGAGKTTVLIARLMKRIINDRVPIRNICALTFTEAAAQEMKSRLLASLFEEQQKNDDPFLEEQITLVETAEISTIHSYCLTLIKNHGHIISLNPKRSENILDESQVKLLKNEAFEIVLNKRLKRNYEQTKNIVSYFSTNPLNIVTFQSSIESLASWLRTKTNPQQAAKDVIKIYSISSFEDLPNHFLDLFYHHYYNSIKSICENLSTYIDIIERDARPHLKVYKESLPIAKVKFDELIKTLELIKHKNISFYDDLLNVLNMPLATIQKHDELKQIRDNIISTSSELIAYYRPMHEHIDMLNELKPLVSQLFDFTFEYMDTYRLLKEKEEAFDFDDFEYYALKLLQKNNNEISKNLKKHYQEIMIDEFQDTNEVQDEIIRLISNGKNLFRVGDVKQSIYGFRGAKPDIMKKLMKDKNHKSLYLSHNYRSKQSIVEFNNIVFNQLMNLTMYSEYSQYDHVSVGLDSQKKDSENVEIHLIERVSDDPSVLVPKKDEIKALHISDQIIQCIQSGKYEFRDITILVRNHQQKVPLKEAFDQANIPYYMSEQIGFYNSDIVSDVLNILKYHNQRNNYHLAHILLSPFFSYHPDDLVNMKKLNNNLREGFRSYDPKTYDLFFNMLDSWTEKGVLDIIIDIYSFNNTYHERLNILDKTNLDALIEKVKHFQENNSSSVSHFIRFIENLDDRKSAEASPLSIDDNVVRVMTVHQSKGLQFPVVFYWGINGLKVQDHKEILLTDSDFGVGINLINGKFRQNNKHIVRLLMETKQKDEELEESLRLLYVALTRPQDKLIIVDTWDSSKDDLIQNKISYLKLYKHAQQVELLLSTFPEHLTEVLRFTYDDMKQLTLPEKTTTKKISLINKPIEMTFKKDIEDSFFSTLEIDLNSKWAMQYGTLLHESIEKLPHKSWNKEDLSSINRNIHKFLYKYNQHPKTLSFYKEGTIYHEYPFIVDFNGDVIHGIIDFLHIHEQNISIVDFKSDNTDYNGLLERYRHQLQKYKNALEIAFPEHSIVTYIYSFNMNDYFLIPLD